jgi:predicted MPP superfamily phosphohydrolase
LLPLLLAGSFDRMSMWARVRAGGAHLFYHYFFRLLLVAASAAQWTVVAWGVSVGWGRSLPWWVHGVAIGALYTCNRVLTSGPTRRRGWVFRIYTATAFVAIFCSIFLLATGAVFALAHGLLGVLSAQALSEGGQVSAGAGLDGAFRFVASFGMAVIALIMGYGYSFGQRELRVTHIPLVVPGFGGDTRRFRIAQISDIHIGQFLGLAQLRAFVERVNASAPDLICITGDIVDSPMADCAAFLPVLDGLRARYGVCAILGNHDHYAGAGNVVAALRRWTSFHVLRDSAVTLALDGMRLHVIGLDDRGRDWARGVQSDGRLAELLDAAPPDTPVLLLAHRPDIFRQAATAGVLLTLSGHTHGGQLALPGLRGRRRNLADFVTAFSRGLYRCGDSHLYVNCGLGVTGQRIRLFTPREITIFDLTPA